MAKKIRIGLNAFAVGLKPGRMVPEIKRIEVVQKGQVAQRYLDEPSEQFWYVKGLFESGTSDIAESKIHLELDDARKELRRRCLSQIQAYVEAMEESER